jgi:hypothetical protein
MTMTAAMTVNAAGMSVAAIRAKLASVRSVRGYSFREANEWNDALRRALANAPELPPIPVRATCCERAGVSYECSCSYVTWCPDHGERHHGTHD